MNEISIDDEFASLFLQQLLDSSTKVKPDHAIDSKDFYDVSNNDLDNYMEANKQPQILNDNWQFYNTSYSVYLPSDAILTSSTFLLGNEVLAGSRELFHPSPIDSEDEQDKEPSVSTTPQEDLNLSNILDFKLIQNDLCFFSSSKPIDFNVLCKLNGRFHINQGSYKKFINKQQQKVVELICYRRNLASIQCAIPSNINDLFVGYKSQEPKRVANIKVWLDCKVLKANKTKDSWIVMDKGVDDTFVVNGSASTSRRKVGVNYLTETHYTIPFDSVGDKFPICWDQIRFNSATANNRHDNDYKYYVLMLNLEFLDGSYKVIGKSTYESNPIKVRGRNPSFYSNRKDVLIKERDPINIGTKRRRNSSSPEAKQVKKKPSPVSEDKIQTNSSHNDTLSTYEYLKVDSNYYLPPVEVGYFPHHVHHSKQVFKMNSSFKNDEHPLKYFNYFM